MVLKAYKQTSPQLGQGAWVDPSAVLYGDISLGADVSIWPLVAARGDVQKIEIGARSNIQDGSVLHVTGTAPHKVDGFPLIIGEDVTVGHKAMLHGCTIGNRVLVGMGAIVLDGVVVEDEVMIAAGSVVPPNKRLNTGFLYMGNPAKPSRELSKQERSFLQRSAQNYVRLKEQYIAEQQNA